MFGSALQLTPHLHLLVPEGVFGQVAGRPYRSERELAEKARHRALEVLHHDVDGSLRVVWDATVHPSTAVALMHVIPAGPLHGGLGKPPKELRER